MKDFLRKLLASLLCICMIGSGLPVSAIAEAMQDSATPPEQQSVSGGAEEQGGQSAQTQASEEQGGTTAQTEVSANEANGVATIDEVIDHQTFNLQKSLGIMPIAETGSIDDFSVKIEIDKNVGMYQEDSLEVDFSTDNKYKFKITLENNTDDTIYLKLVNTFEYCANVGNSEVVSKSAGRFEYGNNRNKAYKKDEADSGPNVVVDNSHQNGGYLIITIGAEETAVLTTESAIDIGALNLTDNSYIKNTVAVTRLRSNNVTDEISDTTQTKSISAETAKYKAGHTGFSVSSAVSTQKDANNFAAADPTALESVSTNDSVVWWYTIKNNGESELKLHVSDKLEISSKAVANGEILLSTTDSPDATFEGGVLSLHGNAIAYLYTQPLEVTMYGGLTLENTVTASVVDDSENAKTAISKLMVTGDPAVKVELSAEKNPTDETSATTEYVEGTDKITLIAQITNTTESALTLDLANALTVAGQPISLAAADGLNLALDEAKSTATGEVKPSLADGKLNLPAGATAYFATTQFTVPYVSHADATPQIVFDLKATDEASSIKGEGTLTLNMTQAKKEFTVTPSYYIDGLLVKTGEENEEELKAKITHIYDANEPLPITYRLEIRNIAADNKTLYFCLEHGQGNVDQPNFEGKDDEGNDKVFDYGDYPITPEIVEQESQSWGYVEDSDNKQFYINGNGKVVLEFKYPLLKHTDTIGNDKDAFAKFTYEVKEIKKNADNAEVFGDVHGYNTQKAAVTLKYKEGVFGYNLSLKGAHFPNIKYVFEGVSDKFFTVPLDDSGATQELYEIGTTGAGAIKYVHACGHTITYYPDPDGKSDIKIVKDVPVVDGYQFVCWFDKNGEASEKVYMPGKEITKNDKAQHTIDAIWVGMNASDIVTVYDGTPKTIENVKIELAGQNDPKKYNLYNEVPPELGDISVTYKVTKEGDTEYEVNNEENPIVKKKDQLKEFFTNADPIELTGFEATDVGVYNIAITASFASLTNEDGTPKTVSCTATLTILPRPVVMQVASGSVDWENGTTRTLTDVDGVKQEYRIVSAFDEGDALKTQASTALSDAIEGIGVDEGDVDGMLANYKSESDVDDFATDENFAEGFGPDVKYYPNTGSVDDAEDSVIGPGTFNAIITNIDKLKADKKTAAAAIAADKPDPVASANGNYVFIGLPGELNIKAPTLETIHITKNVVDAGFESGKFTFTVTEKGGTEPIKFVQIRDGYYVMKDMSKEAVGDGDPSISLTVEKNEEGKATASVSVNVPVGKTYVVRETAATEITPSTGRTADNYLADYDATFSGDAVTPIENEKAAEVTISAEAKDTDNVYVEVTVTNTANFYFVQNYVSDLDDEGEPVKYNNKGMINDKVLEGYPGYVADGDPARYTLTNETTYATIHDGAKKSSDNKNPYVPQTFTDQSIDSPNAKNVADEKTGTGGESAYSFKYDATGDGYVANASNHKYNANKNYLNGHLDAAGLSEAVKPGETVNIFWDRDLNFDFDGDTRYVKVEKINTQDKGSSNQTSTNAIRQSEIKYSTEYIDWTKLSTTKSEDDTRGFDNISVYDSWQKVNAIDLKFSVDKTFATVTPPTTPTPRYIFNTVVAPQANGSNGTHEDITITDSSVYVDNIKGGSSATTLYLTPLVRVKYFIDDGTGKMIPKDGHNYTDINDFIYTVPVDVLVGGIEGVSEAHNSKIADKEQEGDKHGEKYPTTFTVKEVPEDAASKYKFTNGETVNWLLKLHQMDHGVDITTKQDNDGQINIADCLFMDNNGHYFVDDDGYLVVALYLIEAHPAWKVTKEVSTTEATFGDTITYTITIENTGNVDLKKVYLYDNPSWSPIDWDSTVPYTDVMIAENPEVKVTSSDETKTRTFTWTDTERGYIDEIDVGETVTLEYSYVVPDNVKSVSNKVLVDDDEDFSESTGPDKKDPNPPVTSDSVSTSIRNWTVAKTVTGATGGTTEIKLDGDETKTVDVAHVDDELKYAIKIKNTGNVAIDELTVTDSFSINGSTGALSAPTLSSDKEGSNAKFANGKLQNLAVGETVTLTYTYKVHEGDKELKNAATVADSKGEHPRTSEEVVTPVTSFKVEKHVLVNSTYQGARAVVKPGDELTYEVVVTNTGSVEIKKLLITDTMDELESRTRPKMPNVTFTKKSGSGDINKDGNEITNLPAGKSITLQWLGSDFDGVTQPYTVDDNNVHIRNTVTVVDDALSPEVETAFADALVKNWDMAKTVTIERGGKTVTDTVAQVGDKLHYAITVYNTGAEPLTLFVEDTMDGVRFDGSEGAVDPHSPFRSGVEFDTRNAPDAVCSIVTIDGKRYVKITNLEGVDETTYQNSSVTITYSFTVTQPLCDLSKGLHNTAKVHGAEDPKQPETTKPLILESDPHDETETLIEAWSIDKELTAVNGVKPSDPTFGKDAEGKEDKNALVYPAVRVGDKLTYTVTVANTGSAAIAEIDVDDVLTSGKEARDFDGTPAIISVEPAANVTYDGENHLLKGLPAHTTVKLAYTYTVAENEGTLVNAVTASLPGGEEPQKKTVTTEVRDWTVAKEVYKGDYTPKAVPLADGAQVAVGDELTYVITVKNTGSVALTGLRLTDAFTFGDAAPVNGTSGLAKDEENSSENAEYAFANGVGSASIPVGGTLVLTGGYTVQQGDKKLKNAVTVADPDGETNAKTDDVTTRVRSWTVEKTVTKTVNGKTEEANTALPGRLLTYTIKITNTGDVTLNRLYLADVFRDAAKKDGVKALELIPDGPNYQAGEKKGEGVITNLQPGQTFTLKATYEVTKARDESKSDECLVNTVTVDDDPTLDKANDPNDLFPPQSDETETLIKNWNVKKSIAAVYDENGNERESKDGQYVLHVGDQIKYKVFVENTGDTPLTLYVEDSLFIGMAGKKWDEEAVKKATDVSVTFDSSGKGSTWALFADNTDDQTHKGDCLIQIKGLPVGGTATVTYTYTVPAPAEGNEKLFTDGVTNEVVVHANDQTNPNEDKPDHHSEQDPKAETTTQIESWTLDKAITKVTRGEDDVTDNVVSWGYSVQLGDVVTYTITIKNEGSTTIDQLNFVDIFNRMGLPNGGKPLTLDDMKSYGSSKGMNGAKISTDNDGIHITGLTPEETFTLTYETTVLSTDKDALSNAVTVTRKGDTTSKEKVVEVNVRKTFSWSVEKTVEGMSSEDFINGLQCAKVGETLTYKITVTNTGSETLSGLKLEDVFNGNGLKGQQPPIKQVEPDPKTQSYYDKETHIINNLGVGRSVTLAYDYTVVASDIELVNTATVSQPGGAGASQTSEVKTPVETTPAWKVTKEVCKGKYTGEEGDVKLADGDAVSVGDELTYVITVENTGNTSLSVLSVKDVFGGEEIQKELVRFSQGVAYYNKTRAEIQTLDAGRRIVLTYAHKVTTDDTAAGLFNAVTVTLPGEEETDKDEDHHAEVGNPVSAWTITKELTASDGMLGTKAVQIGDTMTYTITIANNGSAEIESLTVEDELIVTGWQYPQLDDMRLSADAPEGVTFTRSSVKDKNGKDTPANTGVLEHLGAGQTAMIECTYKVPGGVYYTSNAARAYPTGRKDEEQKTDPVIMPMYAVVTVHKIWTNADGKRLGANELKQLIGNTEVKFDILRANRTDSAFKPMTDANGVPYGVTLSANETPTWTRDFRSVVRLGNSPDEDDYRLYDVQERGVQTDKDGKTQYVMLNGHRFYYGKSYDFDGKTFNFTFTNELEGAVPTPTPTPGTTSSASATPTPTPSAYVPFTPTPGPAADAKYRVTKTAVNPPARGYYVEGETVQYSIRVQNTGMVPIDALTITDHLSGVTFTSGAGYDLTGAREAFIDHLSAGMSVEIYASYVVTAADVKRGCVTNTVSGDGGTGPDGRPASGNAAEATVPTNDSTYDVTVHYLYLTDGTTAAPDDKINRLRPGDAYRFSCPTIDGYYASSLTVTGTMPAHDVEITVYYVPEDLLPSNGRGGPGLILLDEYGIPLGVGRVMLNVGDCFE